MTKNIRISLYILIPILLWMVSGLFVKDTNNNEAPKKDLFTVGTILSEAVSYQPTIKLKATSRSEARVDVVFIGTGAKERLPWINAITDIPSIQRCIYGNSWRGIKTPGWEQKPAVTGEKYCETINGAKVVLGLLRASNGDQSTDRSYEIGAIGGCGLYQDTAEHRQLLPGYPEEGFFKDPTGLAQRVRDVLGSTALQQCLRNLGAKAIRKHENTYAARLQTIIEWAEQ